MTIKGDLIMLIEQKLVGARRQEALQWARSRRRGTDEMQGLIKRLEGMPDTGAAHSRTVYSDETREKIRADYLAGHRIVDIQARHGVSSETIYRFVDDLPKRRKRRSS